MQGDFLPDDVCVRGADAAHGDAQRDGDPSRAAEPNRLDEHARHRDEPLDAEHGEALNVAERQHAVRRERSGDVDEHEIVPEHLEHALGHLYTSFGRKNAKK